MSRSGLRSSIVGMVMALALMGCGGSKAMGVAAEAPRAAPPTAEASAERVSGTPSATDPHSPSMADDTNPQLHVQNKNAVGSGGSQRVREAAPARRPGLGTAWGENRHSPTTSAPFVRDSSSPFAVSSLWYNDRTGANAMSRYSDYRSRMRGVVPVLGGALTVSLRDERGRALTGFFAGGKDYVVGEAGVRYAIIIRNHTGYRYECVTSVDGLDVIDGRPAAYTKRGYLIQPHGTLEIEGFRRSKGQVAAFRFSSVRGSYSSRSGKGVRNVGVIGVAFFNEEGSRPTWSPGEIRRRHNADPFPGRYAEPPRR